MKPFFFGIAARRTGRWLAPLLAALGLAACTAPLAPEGAGAAWHAQLQRWQGTPLLLLGEQHDAPEHQQWEQETVRWLAGRGQLAALVVEMAEAGHDTAGLPRGASPEQVRQALQWQAAGWPWDAYGPVVMAAVHAGVPVAGGNLPHARLRSAMADTGLDAHLPPEPLARQHEALRQGHCGLLPERQIAPMTRAQLARDRQLAQTARDALRPGRTVLLVAGLGHVQRSLAVPTWLPQGLEYKVAIAQAGQAQSAIDTEADYIHQTAPIQERDHCAELRQRMTAPH